MRSLHEVVTRCEREIAERAVARLRLATPERSDAELSDGVEPFLRELASALAIDAGGRGTATLPGHSLEAARHGRQRYRLGFDVLVVVRDYGAMCDSTTETAQAHEYDLTTREAQILNQCVDAATSSAVEAYWTSARATEQRQADDELRILSDRLRSEVGIGLMAYRALQSGIIGINSKTARMIERSLRRIEHELGKALARSGRRFAPPLALETVEAAGWLRAVLGGVARDRGQTFALEVEPGLAFEAEPSSLGDAVAHLAHNGVLYSRDGATIVIHAYGTADGYVQIDVRDECGGLPPHLDGDRFLPYFIEGGNRDMPALGLAMVQRVAIAHDGEVTVHNRPGHGCTFRLRIPRSRSAGLT